MTAGTTNTDLPFAVTRTPPMTASEPGSHGRVLGAIGTPSTGGSITPGRVASFNGASPYDRRAPGSSRHRAAASQGLPAVSMPLAARFSQGVAVAPPASVASLHTHAPLLTANSAPAGTLVSPRTPPALVTRRAGSTLGPRTATSGAMAAVSASDKPPPGLGGFVSQRPGLDRRDTSVHGSAELGTPTVKPKRSHRSVPAAAPVGVPALGALSAGDERLPVASRAGGGVGGLDTSPVVAPAPVTGSHAAVAAAGAAPSLFAMNSLFGGGSGLGGLGGITPAPTTTNGSGRASGRAAARHAALGGFSMGPSFVFGAASGDVRHAPLGRSSSANAASGIIGGDIISPPLVPRSQPQGSAALGSASLGTATTVSHPGAGAGAGAGSDGGSGARVVSFGQRHGGLSLDLDASSLLPTGLLGQNSPIIGATQHEAAPGPKHTPPLSAPSAPQNHFFGPGGFFGGVDASASNGNGGELDDVLNAPLERPADGSESQS